MRSAPSRIRFVELDIILSHWGLTEEVVAICEVLALKDSDSEVRQVALLCIGKYYARTGQLGLRKHWQELTKELERAGCKLVVLVSSDTEWRRGFHRLKCGLNPRGR